MGKESKNSSGKNYISNQDLGRFKTRSNSTDTLAQFEDPTYLGFKIFFPGIGDNSTGGLLGGADNPNSALYYLNQIGDTTRVKMLDTFIKTLKKINTEYPWYFQSITGLDEAWKARAEIEKPRIKKQLTIECIESLDFRITSLVDLYRKSAYDWNNKREILTDNLRHFDMNIMVYDMRQFQTSLQGNTISGNSPGDTSRQEEVNKSFFGENEFEQSSFTFHFSYVELNLESGSNMFSSINNATNEAAAQSLVFDYELVEESNLFRILSLLYKTDSTKYWYVKDYMNNILKTLSGQGSGTFNTSLLGGSQRIQYSSNIEAGGQAYTANKNLNQLPNTEIGSIFNAPKLSAKEKLENAKNNAATAIGNATEDFVTALGRDIAANATNAISSQLNTLFLGNIYNFSAGSIANGGGRGAAQAATGKLGNVVDKFNSKK